MVLQNREIDVDHLAKEYAKSDRVRGALQTRDDASGDEDTDFEKAVETQSGIERNS